MKTIKAKVHRLPTDKANRGMVMYDPIQKDFFICAHNIPQGETDNIPQHLYITTDEEVKMGEHCIYGGKVITWCEADEKGWNKSISKPRKIIATTDPNLEYMEHIFNNYKMHKLPQIHQSFIEEYCKAGGIDEVLVEAMFSGKCEDPMVCLRGCHVSDGTCKHPLSPLTPEIKLNPDNTIIIHPVEEKMYSREEVSSKIKEFVKEYAYEWDMDDINEWIEENL